jgi:hypothetical protein
MTIFAIIEYLIIAAGFGYSIHAKPWANIILGLCWPLILVGFFIHELLLKFKS